MIDVEHGQRERQPLARRQGGGDGQGLAEGAAVDQAGQAVGRGELGEAAVLVLQGRVYLGEPRRLLASRPRPASSG